MDKNIMSPTSKKSFVGNPTTSTNQFPPVPGFTFQYVIYSSPACTVLAGYEEDTSRRVIAKFSVNEDEVAAYRLHSEYEILLKLQTTGIVAPPVVRYQSSDLLCIITGAVGHTETRMLSSFIPFSTKETIRIVRDIARQLHIVHSQDILHLDVSPRNILMDPSDGSVFLIDYGNARRISKECPEIFVRDVPVVDPRYMSPELTGRLFRQTIDTRTDIYSLGITFYEMLVNSRPFHGTIAELTHSHIAVVPPSPRQVKPIVPAVVSDIVMKMIAKSPRDRYHTCLGILEDLKRCLDCLNDPENSGSIPPFELGLQDGKSTFRLSSDSLYGQKKLLHTLLEAWKQVSVYGSTNFSVVTGYSGVGKSSLVHEIQQAIIASRGIFLEGKYDLMQQGVPFSAILSAMSAYLQEVAAGTPDEIKSWCSRIEALIGTWLPTLRDLIPELAAILDQNVTQESFAIAPKVETKTENMSSPVLSLPPQDSHLVALNKLLISLVTPKQPVVLFLDDCQWADISSMRLLQQLMFHTHGVPSNMMIICAYRWNEVAERHSLRVIIEQIKAKCSSSFLELFVTPLSPKSMNRMISEVLHRSTKDTLPLTKSLYRRTLGNPYYTKELLRLLYIQNVFRFDDVKECWEWNMEKVENMEVSANVAEFMVSRLETFGKGLKVLGAAACIGNVFTVEFLLCALPECTNMSLISVLEEGVSSGFLHAVKRGISYGFVHDRIQKSALSFLTPEQKSQIHDAIGRVLLSSCKDESDIEESQISPAGLFLAVDHMNQSQAAIKDDENITYLVRLNLHASKKAFQLHSEDRALVFLEKARGLMQADWDQKHHDLWYDVHFQHIFALICDKKYRPAKDGLEHLTSKTSITTLERAKLRFLQSSIHEGEGEVVRALDTALDGMSLLGYNIAPGEGASSATDMHTKIQKLNKDQHKLTEEDLRQIVTFPILPVLSKELSVLEELLIKAISAAQVISTSDSYYIACLGSEMYVNEKVLSPNAAYVFVSYASGLAEDGYHQEAYQFGKLGQQIFHSCPSKRNESIWSFLFGGSVMCCGEPQSACRELLTNAFHLSLEIGNVMWASYDAYSIVISYALEGHNLHRAYKETNPWYDFCDRNAEPWIPLIITAVRSFDCFFLCANLDGGYNDGDSDEGIFLSAMEQAPSFVLFVHMLFKCFAMVIMGEYQEALSACQVAEATLPHGIHAFQAAQEFWYVSGLVYAMGLRETRKRGPTFEDEGDPFYSEAFLMKGLENSIKHLKELAAACPQNYLCKLLVLKAERESARGKLTKALKLYPRAFEEAAKQGFNQHAALMAEMASMAFRKSNMRHSASEWANTAHRFYRRWGCTLKLKQFGESHAERHGQEFDTSNDGKGADVDEVSGVGTDVENSKADLYPSSAHYLLIALSSNIDVAAVLEASKRLSSEINLDNLLKTIMQIIVANSGAQKALLFLSDMGRSKEVMTSTQDLYLEAVRDVADDSFQFRLHTPLSNVMSASQSVLHYVVRTRMKVVLHKGINDSSQFAKDAYVHQQGLKSLLCMPILNQSRLSGVLYLENKNTEAVFSEERVGLLEVLAAHMAVSLDNAALYGNLEHIVQQRTRELEIQRKLVEQEFKRANYERERADELVYKMLPKHIADLMKKGEEVPVQDHPAVTALFTDIVGFTEIAQRLGPARVCRMLNDMYLAYDRLTEKHKMWKVETIGDAYYGISGALQTRDDHADLAADMALDILKFMASFVLEDGTQLRVRIGLNTGAVQSGIVGSSMPHWSFFGDTINTASRMESTGEAQKIHCSEATYLALCKRYHFEERGTMQVKGKGEMRTYWLIGKK